MKPFDSFYDLAGYAQRNAVGAIGAYMLGRSKLASTMPAQFRAEWFPKVPAQVFVRAEVSVFPPHGVMS